MFGLIRKNRELEKRVNRLEKNMDTQMTLIVSAFKELDELNKELLNKNEELMKKNELMKELV